jgi:hypothetical protein
MVCPNCKSDQIIQVQDQHFCISCGQQVPAEAAKPAKAGAGVAVQDNGLPEGVKILPVSAAKTAAKTEPDPAPAPTPEPKPEEPKAAAPAPAAPAPEPAPASASPLIKFRSRIKPDTEEETEGESKTDAKPEAPKAEEPKPEPKPAAEPAPEPPAPEPEPAAAAPEPAAPAPEPAPVVPIITEPPKNKKRKPGRPKAGRLDAPKPVASTTAAALPAAPALAPGPEPEPAPATGPKRMSDLSRRAPAAPEEEPAKKPAKKKSGGGLFGFHRAKHKAKPEAKPTVKAEHVHKVGVPPLHYGAVLAFSLRARVRPRLVVMGSLAAVSFAVAAAYGAWLYTQDGFSNLADTLESVGPKILVVGLLLAALYYIGRSISQAAIIYGVARESDSRPVPLARQFGIGVNTFGRRLVLDLGFAAVELTLLGLILGLVWFGGSAWPVDVLYQRVALYFAFLILLYLLSSLAIARGLAGVVLTLTPKRPKEAAQIGWRLFSHRFELLGLKCLGASLELVLALPLVAVAVALISAAPAGLDLAVAIAVGLLALVAGALFGAGTAAWWAALYRRLILVDYPNGAVNLLSGRQPQEANRTPLVLIVSVSTLLIAGVLTLPWLRVL